MNRIIQKKSFKDSIIKSILDGTLPIAAGNVLSPGEMSLLIKSQANFEGTLQSYIHSFPCVEKLNDLMDKYMSGHNTEQVRWDIVGVFTAGNLLSEFPAFQMVYVEGVSRFNLLLCACILKSYKEEKVIKTSSFEQSANFCQDEGLPTTSTQEMDSELLEIANKKRSFICDEERDSFEAILCERLVEKYQSYIRVQELFEFIGQYALGKYA